MFSWEFIRMGVILGNVVVGVGTLAVVKRPSEELPNILLVDGDQVTASQVKRWFKVGAHASLGHAGDGVAAARMMAERAWDLVVIDLAVPGGLEFLRQAKSLNRWLATLVVTEVQSPDLIQLAVQCRIDGLMFKPIVEVPFLKQALELAEEACKRRWQQQKRVLAISAHPDDVEIGCGGALARHHAKGDELHILTLSRGSAGGDANVRAVEAHRAAELLGAKLQLANLRDAHISEGAETIELIQAAIQKFQPTHVYTHSFEDTHQDHRAAYTATLAAARSVPNVYSYQSPSSTVEFRPHRFVDISDFIEAKLRALGCHKSQVARSASLSDDVIVATARYWGRYAGYVMAEPIRIVRQRAGFRAPGIGAGHQVQAAPAMAA
jgi:LmbE family N-acetylglucosaminyl deacetylase